MLLVGGGASHGHVERPVYAVGHQLQVALGRLLRQAVVRHVDVGEDAMEVEAGLLACTATTTAIEKRETGRERASEKRSEMQK